MTPVQRHRLETTHNRLCSALSRSRDLSRGPERVPADVAKALTISETAVVEAIWALTQVLGGEPVKVRPEPIRSIPAVVLGQGDYRREWPEDSVFGKVQDPEVTF